MKFSPVERICLLLLAAMVLYVGHLVLRPKPKAVEHKQRYQKVAPIHTEEEEQTESEPEVAVPRIAHIRPAVVAARSEATTSSLTKMTPQLAARLEAAGFSSTTFAHIETQQGAQR